MSLKGKSLVSQELVQMWELKCCAVMLILDIDHRLFLCESFIWFQGGTELECKNGAGCLCKDFNVIGCIYGSNDKNAISHIPGYH